MADGSFARAPLASDSIALQGRRKRRVVGFAGGGGSSIAIHHVLGAVDAALNHWPTALAVHERNFPEAAHYCADIFDTDCRDVCPGEEIELLWLSPDCRHFSKAKGGAPVSERVRGLAWVAIPWAKLRKPDVIMLENVEEFLTWGPVKPDGKGGLVPDPARKGQTFAKWVRRLEACGYAVEWRILNAADYGAPTSRKRLFLIARRDGRPIVWPAPTHAPRQTAAARGLKPYRAAADIIDWSRPCPSIFLSPEEARVLRVKRPLEEATLARIAKGLLRYTIGNADPFIVPVTHKGDSRTYDVRDPLKTVTCAKRGEFAMVAPVLTSFYGERDPANVRASSLEDPLHTVTASPRFPPASAFLTKFSENGRGYLPTEPLHTVMAGAPRHSLVAAFMEQANTGMVGHDARSPVSTIASKAANQRLVTAALTQFRGSNEGNGGDVGEPLGAVCAQGGHHGLLETILEADQDMAVPFGRERELRAFLVKYYGTATAQDLADPLHSVTSRARFGLVVVAGVAWRIVDIGMRMLDPETELAAAMGVPKGYVLGFDVAGNRVTKTDINKMVGNMVCPDPAAALIAANFDAAQPERVAA
ncbi:DNA cytosine methyltransferase [Brevundimonas sp.]|uniref:DNA cytosine methyltransferase n=1 Tax=Brevundimonas sp. TaxID=1871086 RepID=UPI002D434058|nr:DNA cytosine methyltransferase [Brevundimonas sp.]HYD26918.1 DNA cytosine methyltransferase [Brevundimonas sp.]